MSEKLTLGTYPELPIDYPSAFDAIFDIGAGDLAHPHSGYIIDNTMSIIHSAPTVSQGNQKKIEAIKGWRVIGQNKLDENTPLTEGIIIYINKEDYESTPDSFIVQNEQTGKSTPYSSWVLVDTYSTIWENQNVIVEAVDTEPFNLYTLSDDSQGYEMRIKFDPPLSRAPDKIIGIYKPNAMGEGPAPLYGKYEIITGQHRYRAMGNYGNSFGHNSMAQGPYSFAQGQQSVAYGHASHAEGRSSVAAGNFSHSEGESNAAIGTASHASGYQTKAIGYASQTMGFETVAEGDYSFAAGIGTITKHPYSMAVGEYNTGECPNSCFEVGTGSRAARATGFYVSRNGLCYAPQTTIDNLEAQGDKALVTKEYLNYYSISIQIDKETGCMYRMYNGVQEWFNPPMENGIVYRTTERSHGLPVYTMCVGLTPSSQIGALSYWDFADTLDEQSIDVIGIYGVLVNTEFMGSHLPLPAFTEQGVLIASIGTAVQNDQDDNRMYHSIYVKTHSARVQNTIAQVIVKFTNKEII